MENNGYIKLHRRIFDNPRLHEDNDYFTVWVKLLLLATHQKKRAVFKGKDIILNAGQLITGRNFLARFCNINSSKVERILKWLKNEHQIEQQTSNKNRLITIVKWHKYQKSEQQTNNKTNNKRTTSEHIQECKECKERYASKARTSKNMKNYLQSDSVEEVIDLEGTRLDEKPQDQNKEWWKFLACWKECIKRLCSIEYRVMGGDKAVFHRVFKMVNYSHKTMNHIIEFYLKGKKAEKADVLTIRAALSAHSLMLFEKNRYKL